MLTFPNVAQCGYAANGMQRWGWTPTSAPVAHDRLRFVSQQSLLRAKKQRFNNVIQAFSLWVDRA